MLRIEILPQGEGLAALCAPLGFVPPPDFGVLGKERDHTWSALFALQERQVVLVGYHCVGAQQDKAAWDGVLRAGLFYAMEQLECKEYRLLPEMATLLPATGYRFGENAPLAELFSQSPCQKA